MMNDYDEEHGNAYKYELIEKIIKENRNTIFDIHEHIDGRRMILGQIARIVFARVGDAGKLIDEEIEFQAESLTHWHKVKTE